ncbi:MAG: chorismate mutase [Deltaproteobacteria bacterium]|nr:chorismate mutase [Deltaproteobacteria bacterium]
MTLNRLEQLRQSVSKINIEILQMLNRRGDLALEIWETKQHLGMSLQDNTRERTQLDELTAANSGPFPDETIREIFRKIFEDSRELMKTGKTEV